MSEAAPVLQAAYCYACGPDALKLALTIMTA